MQYFIDDHETFFVTKTKTKTKIIDVRFRKTRFFFVEEKQKLDKNNKIRHAKRTKT